MQIHVDLASHLAADAGIGTSKIVQASPDPAYGGRTVSPETQIPRRCPGKDVPSHVQPYQLRRRHIDAGYRQGIHGRRKPPHRTPGIPRH